MQFNLIGKISDDQPLPKKIIRVMKLTAFFLTIICLHAGARGFSQNINLSGKDLSLEDAFSSIERQTGFFFFYKYNELKQAKPVSVDIKNGTLEQALDQCLKGQPFTWHI